MRRYLLAVNLLFLVLAWVFASQDWATAKLVDGGAVISVTALESYPQASIVLTILAALSLFSRYFVSLFSKFLISSVAVLLFATISPMWFDSAAGNLSILKPQITKLTGIADWNSALEALQSSTYNHFASDFFIISVVLGLAGTAVLIWSTRAKDGSKAVLSTRIDNLPKW